VDIKNVFFDALLYAMEGEDPSKAIENQEKRGQKLVVRRCMLPIKTNGGIPDEIRFNGVLDNQPYKVRHAIVQDNIIEFTKNQYEKMGIKIIDKEDDLFYSVELPEGWKIKATSHSMWNDLIDNKGRTRASFFYKAAFYDRDAFINFNTRYSFRIEPFDNYESDATFEERKSKPWYLYVVDNGKTIKNIAEAIACTDKDYYHIDDRLREIGRNYMDKNYPDWKDINSYWD